MASHPKTFALHVGTPKQGYTKVCQNCESPNGLRVKKCQRCGSEFSKKEKNWTSIEDHARTMRDSYIKEKIFERIDQLSTKDGWTGLVFLIHENTLPNGRTKVFTHGYATRGTGHRIQKAIGSKVFNTMRTILDGLREEKELSVHPLAESSEALPKDATLPMQATTSSDEGATRVPSPSLTFSSPPLSNASELSPQISTTCVPPPQRVVVNEPSALKPSFKIDTSRCTSVTPVSSKLAPSTPQVTSNITTPSSSSQGVRNSTQNQLIFQNTKATKPIFSSSSSTNPLLSQICSLQSSTSTTTAIDPQSLSIEERSNSSILPFKIVTLNGSKVLILQKSKDKT